MAVWRYHDSIGRVIREEVNRMSGPVLHIDPEKIRDNAREICRRLPGIDVVGVAKVTCAHPAVARALVEGGTPGLGDSRLLNLRMLRRQNLGVPLWLLRSPDPAWAAEVVDTADVSLVAELDAVRALEAAAAGRRRLHRIILMIDLGDLREGIMPRELEGFLAELGCLRRIELAGLGTNLTCFGGVVPTAENLGELVSLARRAEDAVGHGLLVSGGNSSTLDLAFAGGLPPGITGLRIGESILLGVSTVTRRPHPGLHTDAFMLEAPVVECRVKPSLPRGLIAQDAFGHVPVFTDRGPRLSAICAVGRQDVVPEGLTPLDPGIVVVGASSDHLLLDVQDAEPHPRVGDRLCFLPSYGAVLTASTSPYVEKVLGTSITATEAAPEI